MNRRDFGRKSDPCAAYDRIVRPVLLASALLIASLAAAQGAREGRPMRSVAQSRCGDPCTILARKRIGGVRVRVRREGEPRHHSYSLETEVGGQRYRHFLGGDGNPGDGSSMPQSYHFVRLEAVEIDGDRSTPEVVVLGIDNGQPSADVCRLAPTPCCLFSMVAGRTRGRIDAPTFDGRGHLMVAGEPVDLRFCE